MTTATEASGYSVRATIRRILLSGSVGMLAVKGTSLAADLPVPCIAGACGSSVTSWVSSGAAQATRTSDTLTINQSTDQVTLNWSSFNVSADGHVIFNQPSRSSIALNRIFQDSPSQILGRVDANGQIYLINPNGMVFGKTATVNAAGIMASTLKLSDENFAAGIASPSILQGLRATLESDGTAGALSVEQGAKLTATGSGGRVLLAAPQIDNAGSISAADGQVILAAGDKVYLQASTDPSLRGLLVEVGEGGAVTNAVTGEISTPRGNTTLIGMAVNQQGRISATTTVAANGSIRLLARGGAAAASVGGAATAQATETGTLVFGSQSVTAVTAELADATTAVGDQAQLPSTIEGVGHQVLLQGGSSVIANGGTLKLSAQADPRATVDGTTPTLTAGFQDSASQLLIEAGAHIDLSGNDATLPMSNNAVSVELRANELRDSPDQRDSAIRGLPLVIDARVGTTLGDVSAAIAAVPQTIAQRTSAGGSAVFTSDGSIVVDKSATIDVSGGQLNYQSGYLQTSLLVGADGNIYDVGTADPSMTYVAVINPTYRQVDDRWGRVTDIPAINAGQLQAGYVQGANAGSLQFAAPSMVLNGTFRAATVVGPYQRAATSLPQGGTFIVGLQNGFGQSPTLDYRAPDVTFVSSTPDISVAPGAALPAWMSLELPVDYLHNGFTRTFINSNGQIHVAMDTPLDLAPGSTFSLTGQAVSIDSSISAIGGKVTLATRDTIGLPALTIAPEQISLARGVTIDVSGGWINDSQALGPLSDTPLFQDAGSITLKLGGTLGPATLQLGDDVSLLANGGAWYGSSVTGGRGGAISLLTTRTGALQDTTWKLGEDIRLEGFGVANAAGGSIAIDAPAIQVVQGSTWSRAQQLAAGDTDDYLQLGTALFSDYGFSRISLTASRPSTAADPSRAVLEIRPGTTVQARVLTRALADSASLRASGGTVADFSSTYLPLIDKRQASTVSFAAGLAYGSSNNAGSLSLDVGAIVQGDAGSKYSFSSAGNLLLAGTVRAVGGTVSANVTGPPATANVIDSGYVTGRKLELTDTAIIDVSGAEISVANDAGLLSGKVIQGGTVSLVAERGIVAVDAGARIDVSGGTAALDLPTGKQTQPYQRQQVGSAAGSLSVSTREGAYLLGDIDAHAGADDSGTLAAGSLTVEVARSAPTILRETYPAGLAEINVTQDDLPVVGTIPPGYVGISAAQIARAGFDSVTLRAFDGVSSDGGHIVLGAGLDLSLARQVSLQAPVIQLAGAGSVKLQAPYLSIGDGVQVATPPSTISGGAVSLSVMADNVDLLGTTTLLGASQANINSTGDIRLQSAYLSNGTPQGSFTLAGDLTLAAARVYATTGGEFTLAATGPTDRIHFVQQGASPGVPLSAGSQLRVVAHEIDQGGTLLAPFGSISLEADSLNLLDGSVTSVSGKGSLVPYGYVLNGVWYYDNGHGGTSTAVDSLPTRNISLSADDVTIAPSATMDISGGGDLYAYEWIPGTGGSTDALAAGARPGLYAVLPSLAGQIAPIDPREYVGSDLHPGDSIYLSGYGDLPAGFYPLLPARYALLPGALLVSVVQGSAEYLPGNPSTLSNGTPVIAGYRTFGDTGLGSAQLSGIAIQPGSYGRRLAEYTDYYASSYLPARALLLEASRFSVPVDAGSLSIFARDTLDARGKVNSAAAQGGRGASIGLSAENLTITNSTGASTPGTVSIAASTLNSWAPAQLTLGGTRTDAADPTLSVTADHVQVDSGVTLAAQDVLLAARQDVHVASGATIATPSGLNTSSPSPVLGAESELTFADSASAGAAILAVSDLNPVGIARATGSTAGTITLDAGSVVATRGALNIDAPGGVTANGSLRVTNAQVGLGAGRIAFADSAQAGTLTIDAALQATLQSARSLRLSGSESIDFQRNTNFAFNTASGSELELHAPVVNGVGAVQVVLSADTVVLGGGAIANTTTPASGSAALAIHADNVELSEGHLDFVGFSNTTVVAATQVSTSGTSLYRVGGDLQVQAPRILVANGADASIDATGAVQLAGGNSTAAASTGLELGGALDIHAQQITDNALIQASSGSVSLRADSSLALQDNAAIDVAGRMVSAGDQQLGSQGGTVTLAAGTDLSSTSGSHIDLSAAGDSTAGTLTVAAGSTASLAGSLQAKAMDRADGGDFLLSAGSLASFSTLNSQLEAGGFTGSRSVSVNTGDLDLAAGETVSAQSVQLVSNAGHVRVDGTIDASAVDTKGAIRIQGGAGVAIGDSASLSTDSTGTADGGGDIDIGSLGGPVQVATTSHFSATGPGSNGNLILRAPVTGNDVAIDALPTDLSRVAGLIVAPLFTTDVSAAPTAANLTAARQPATNFVNQYGTAVLARLNPGNQSVTLSPEIRLQRDGDLTLGAIDLSTWRFGGRPGYLTVVATGDIQTTGNISDGFTGTGNTLALATGDSTSISLTAGQDLLLGSNTTIRTGTGNLTLSAGRDVVFGSGATVYTGGAAGIAARSLPASTGTVNVAFPDRGGDLSISAGRDVLGSPVAQSVTDWQYRGTRTGATQVMPRLWGILPSGFGWNVGTLGGGDVHVRAGRNVSDLSAAAADSELVNTDDSVQHFGGGSLQVSAGGDIDSGQYFVGSGRLVLSAGDAIGSDRESDSGGGLGSLLWMANTDASLTARTGVLIESVLNPTALLVPRAPNTGPRPSSFFSYSDDASLRVQSAAGDVAFNNNVERLQPFIEDTVRLGSGDVENFTLYPPTLDARSYSGDVYFERTAYLFPAAQGQLNLFASRDIYSDRSGGVLMSDGKASGISTVLSPSVGFASLAELTKGASGSRHLGSEEPALISAGRDVRDINISVPVAATVVAGRDVRDVSLVTQNLDPDDVTLVQAGRDVSASTDDAAATFQTGGPGRLDLLAGRNVDLGFSQGIVTTGSLGNATLPFDEGADISVFAGLGNALDFTAFINNVIATSVAYGKDVATYMQQLDGVVRDPAAALTAFRDLDATAQRPLVTRLFFNELVQSGREANQPGGDFERGYAAIDALFPGSRKTGSANPYAGDLNMSFSRIYTLDGGNISLLVPGGKLNVGLANPPPSIGTRDPSQLGIVAQRAGNVSVFTRDDVLVNQSRIFTLLGGSIAIWSTLGNIDAGRGAKSSVSAPPPTVIIDDTGKVTIDFSAAVAGSGIRTVITGEGVAPGDVDLIAPVGFVNAGDAGIGASGNLNIAAQTVVGLDNIQVGGVSTGVPRGSGGCWCVTVRRDQCRQQRNRRRQGRCRRRRDTHQCTHGADRIELAGCVPGRFRRRGLQGERHQVPGAQPLEMSHSRSPAAASFSASNITVTCHS
ncbi:MAG: filamentous hemagglutinin family protein [Pseudomonadota bacterium]